MRTLTMVAVALAVAGCTQTPETACEKYDSKREELTLTHGPEVVKECTKQLAALEKRNAEAFTCTAKCIKGSQDAKILVTCPWRCEDATVADPAVRDRWQLGIAVDASGTWADEKGAELTDAQCNDGGWVIAAKKYAFGVIDNNARYLQETQLAEDCKKQKKDKAAVDLFRCMRRAKDKDAMFGCSGPATRTDVVVIEACVKKCRNLHGSSPKYQGCFNSCKPGL